MIAKFSLIKGLTLVYVLVAFVEIVSEHFAYKPLIFALKPLIPLVLAILYYTVSTQKNWVIIAAFVLSMVTNLLFIPANPIYLFYAVIVFTIHRIVVLYTMFSLQKITDYIPLALATAPFLLVFFYMFMETTEIPDSIYGLLILQNILISLLAGISLSSYVMLDNKQNSILLISALLFVMLQFSIFIEKYYLTNEFQGLFRPLAMTLNALAFYSFYSYVVVAEKATPQL